MIFHSIFILILGLTTSPLAMAQKIKKPSAAQIEAAMNKNPNNIKLREQAGRAYLNTKNYKKTIEILAPYSNEISGESLTDLAEAYGETGDNINQIRVLQGFAESESSRFRPHFLLGMAFKKDKKFDDAAKSLRRSIELAPKHRPSYDALVEIFAETKQNYESRMLLNDMVKVFGPKKDLAHKLCRLYAIDSYIKEALETCKDAIRLDPQFPDSHVYLAQSYYNQENSQAAERILKTAARQFKTSEFVQYAAGEYYLNEKNYPSAVRYLDLAVKINPEALRSQLTLANALFEAREPARAMLHFDKACQMDKTNESILAFKSAAARLRKNNLHSMADQYDRKTATCQKI